MTTFLFTTLLSIFISSATTAEPLSEERCKEISDIPQTKAKEAVWSQLIRDLLDLKDTQGRKIIPLMNGKLEAQLRELFQVDPSKISKLEQFYGLLYLIGYHKALPERRVDFDRASVKKLLLSSAVFSTPDVPESIQSVSLFWNKAFDRATYEVKFNKERVEIPLNNGNGFATFREGLCQIAQKLVFYGGFEFLVYPRGSGNYFVTDFKNVDLFGQFGARGMVDVDIQYVSVKSVEFLKGSPMGIVRAKISPKEFEINDHSVLLKMVSKLVTDKSTQPIDW